MTIYSLDVLLFLIWNQSVVPRPVLTVASWPAYRFLKRQVRWPGIPIFSKTEYHQLNVWDSAAAAAKSPQSCLTLCDPIDGSPPGSRVPGILQARALEWVAISFSNARRWKVKVKSLSHVWLLATPWTVAHQAPPSMGFSRQEYWSGVPLPSLWDSAGYDYIENWKIIEHLLECTPFKNNFIVESFKHIQKRECEPLCTTQIQQLTAHCKSYFTFF